MKRLSKSWIFKACNFCIAFAGILHWTKMSLLLFGEQPYPTEDRKVIHSCHFLLESSYYVLLLFSIVKSNTIRVFSFSSQ